VSARPVVDRASCEGHALCLSAAPTVFDLDATERAYVREVEITEDLLPQIEDAITSCPTQAIRFEELT
jgi:ferredoxin